MNRNDGIGYLLNKSSRLSKCEINKKLCDIGITFPQLIVIKHLAEKEDKSSAITPAAIAEHLGYDRPTISGIIDRLTRQGFVLREPNPSDRRSQAIVLTEKSKQLAQKMGTFFNEVEAKMTEGFEENEIKELKGYLRRIMSNLGAQKCCGVDSKDQV